jgi:hypothetical protein
MFNSGILDVVIGLVVIYLQLSLVCTAVHELIASGFKKRAKELERGLGQLLSNPQLVAKFYSHPLIKGLRPDGGKPSYIPSPMFALTVMDIVRRHSFDGTLSLATESVTEKTAAQLAAQAALDEANKRLVAVTKVRQVADERLVANVGDRLEATRAAQEAATEEAALAHDVTDATIKLEAATKAKADAVAHQVQVKIDADQAKAMEATARTAEDAAALTPKDKTKQTTAQAARQAADEAAYKLAPSASSLLTEARAKVADVQNEVVPPALKAALLALMDNAGTDLNKAQANLEQWFNDAMDRVSGVYKRKSQVWVLVIAILVTVFANVDSLQIADSLSRDKALRESLVAAAPELAKADSDAVARERAVTQPSPTPQVSPSPASAGSKPAAGATQTQSATPTPTASPSPAQTPSLRNVTASLDEIKKLGVPLGYIRVCTPGEEKRLEDNCPNAIDAAVMNAEASLKKAQDDLDTANAKLQKASAAQTAAARAKTAFDAAQKTVAETPSKPDQVTNAGGTANADAERALAKAKDALGKANDEVAITTVDIETVEATRDLAAAQVKVAKTAHDQAVKAAVTAKKTEADAVTAEAKADVAES